MTIFCMVLIITSNEIEESFKEFLDLKGIRMQALREARDSKNVQCVGRVKGAKKIWLKKKSF